jgi:hypothetical protein
MVSVRTSGKGQGLRDGGSIASVLGQTNAQDMRHAGIRALLPALVVIVGQFRRKKVSEQIMVGVVKIWLLCCCWACIFFFHQTTESRHQTNEILAGPWRSYWNPFCTECKRLSVSGSKTRRRQKWARRRYSTLHRIIKHSCSEI